MTKSRWQPSSWLGYAIASLPCFKWEDVHPLNVEEKMPDLLRRLIDLASGNISRRRVTTGRNYTSLSRSQPIRSSATLQSETEQDDSNR